MRDGFEIEIANSTLHLVDSRVSIVLSYWTDWKRREAD